MNRKTVLGLVAAFAITVLASWAVLAFLATSGRLGFAPHDRVAGPVVFGAVALFGLMWVFLATGIGIFVYRDSRARGMEPVLWTIVAVVIPYFIGLVAYLVVRSTHAASCPRCHASMPTGAAYCPACGGATTLRCPACGRETPPEAAYCPWCGAAAEQAPLAGM